ncbi:MAG TPA: plastocyanin/azurin family copper-binding protein [Intrasporangium sp.]|uniref:plastocyanin/azurin family copper-binding protein n=1 Tax=Intrasporangium sp. TaxID=1925024 RepID=UPI002D77C4B4|nr:plastocyanin/azurin family copper-binding protein [Intrasporangium sp.]HET7397707.1 plastocyanin/azurin family copper-binding protein [Intrasporangium sp.]
MSRTMQARDAAGGASSWTDARSLTRRRFHRVMGLGVCSALLAACSDAGKPNAAPSSGAASSRTASSAASTSTGPDPDEVGTATLDPGASAPVAAGVVKLEVGSASGAREFRYDKGTLEAPVGSKIRLKFSNHTDPKDEVGHNWVLVKAGQESRVVASGQAAGDDKDWLDVHDPAIVAHTRLIEGGQSNTITFTAPAGTYTYLCTFPQHFAAGEKGTLVIK